MAIWLLRDSIYCNFVYGISGKGNQEAFCFYRWSEAATWDLHSVGIWRRCGMKISSILLQPWKHPKIVSDPLVLDQPTSPFNLIRESRGLLRAPKSCTSLLLRFQCSIPAPPHHSAKQGDRLRGLTIVLQIELLFVVYMFLFSESKRWRVNEMLPWRPLGQPSLLRFIWLCGWWSFSLLPLIHISLSPLFSLFLPFLFMFFLPQ